MSLKSDRGDVKRQLEACRGLDYIEDLQHHNNVPVYKIAFMIVDVFFNEYKFVCILSINTFIFLC